MKLNKLVFNVLLSIVFLSACNSPEKQSENSENPVTISFVNTEYDFGKIAYNSDGRCFFEFTNDSDAPLIVNKVRTTCGCTRPQWPKKPVQPGESEKIGITYNTRIEGKFHKSITVYSNAQNSPVKLTIKGIVENKEKS